MHTVHMIHFKLCLFLIIHLSSLMQRPPENQNGASVYDITDNDVDDFKATENFRREVDDQHGSQPSHPRYFKLFITIVCWITCILCLWPFSCICLCLASYCSERVRIIYNYNINYEQVSRAIGELSLQMNNWLNACI